MGVFFVEMNGTGEPFRTRLLVLYAVAAVGIELLEVLPAVVGELC